MLNGNFGPFDPHGNMQRMRKIDLNNVPPGTEKVVKDKNGEGILFRFTYHKNIFSCKL